MLFLQWITFGSDTSRRMSSQLFVGLAIPDCTSESVCGGRNSKQLFDGAHQIVHREPTGQG